MNKKQRAEWVDLIMKMCYVTDDMEHEYDLPQGYRRVFSREEAEKVVDVYFKGVELTHYAQNSLRHYVRQENKLKPTDKGVSRWQT